MRAAEHESDLKHTTNTSYLALTGELWGSFVRKFEKTDRVMTAPHCIYLLSYRI